MAAPCPGSARCMALLQPHPSSLFWVLPEPPVPPGWGSSPAMPPAQPPPQPRGGSASLEVTQQGSEEMTAVAWTHTIAHPGTRGRGWTCCWHPERHRGRHREARAGHPRGRAATRLQEHLPAILQPPPHTPRFALQTWNRSGSADLPSPSARAGDTAGIGVTTQGPARCCGQTGGTRPLLDTPSAKLMHERGHRAACQPHPRRI